MSVTLGRQAAHPVDEIFLQRWSPRAFTGEAIPEADFQTILEAARWAPSVNNLQPWRLIYVRRGAGNFDGFLGALNPGKQIWAKNAAVLICFASKTTLTKEGVEVPSPSHSLDTGAAWMALALQATKMGWHAHAMAGFNPEAMRKTLNVPEGIALNICVAVGRQGPKTLLPEALAARETPSQRRPLSEIAFADKMS